MLEIFVAGRGGGKTHKLCEMVAKDSEGLLVTSDVQACNHAIGILASLLRDRGVPEMVAAARAQQQVLVANNSLWIRLQGTSYGHIYIDNVKGILSYLFRGEVVALADNALVSTPQGKRFEPLEDNPHLPA